MPFELEVTHYTAEELDELARIKDADILSADRSWRTYARPAFADLLRAQPLEEDASPTP